MGRTGKSPEDGHTDLQRLMTKCRQDALCRNLRRHHLSPYNSLRMSCWRQMLEDTCWQKKGAYTTVANINVADDQYIKKHCWLTLHRHQRPPFPLPPCMATALVTKSTLGLDQNKPGYSFRDLGKSWSGRPSYSHSSRLCGGCCSSWVSGE